MKPSEQCKAAGLKNLKELSIIAKVSSETLVNWSKNRPDVFRLLIAGVVAEAKKEAIEKLQRIASAVKEYPQYGCHCDLDEGQQPDNCVFDGGRIDDCVKAVLLAKEGRPRNDCDDWRLINATK